MLYIYECVRRAKCTREHTRAVSENEMLSRWERMVDNKDDAELWKAVNWAGELKQDENLVKPSDDEFKAYIEGTQNIQAVYTNSLGDDVISRVTVPVLNG